MYNSRADCMRHYSSNLAVKNCHPTLGGVATASSHPPGVVWDTSPVRPRGRARERYSGSRNEVVIPMPSVECCTSVGHEVLITRLNRMELTLKGKNTLLTCPLGLPPMIPCSTAALSRNDNIMYTTSPHCLSVRPWTGLSRDLSAKIHNVSPWTCESYFCKSRLCCMDLWLWTVDNYLGSPQSAPRRR